MIPNNERGESPPWFFIDRTNVLRGAVGLQSVPVALVIDSDGRIMDRASIGKLAVTRRVRQWFENTVVSQSSLTEGKQFDVGGDSAG